MITPITGTVIHGKKLGRTLGFPTANVSYSGNLEDGVYKMNIVYQEKIYPGMGTFFADRQLLEAHLFDVDIDLYDQEIVIYPLLKIRDNKKFSSLDELVDQITIDMEKIRNISRTVLTFGTFDHLHPGHLSYLRQAKAYGDQLITIVALDETVHRIKNLSPDTPESERVQDVQGLGILNHIVQLGNKDNVYHCLDQRSPEVIYLGYDQRSFDTGIQTYYTGQSKEIPHIIRGVAYHPEKYKSSLLRN